MTDQEINVEFFRQVNYFDGLLKTIEREEEEHPYDEANLRKDALPFAKGLLVCHDEAAVLSCIRSHIGVAAACHKVLKTKAGASVPEQNKQYLKSDIAAYRPVKLYAVAILDDGEICEPQR